jgi:replicative DNA helicase
VWQYERIPEQSSRYLIARASLQTDWPIGIARMRRLSGRLDDFMPGEFNHIENLSRIVSEWPLNVIHCSGQDVRILCAKIERSKSDVHIIDHLSIIPVEGEDTEYRIMTKVSNMLRQTAKRTKKCIVGLLQMNRAIDGQERRPVMSDLRGSGHLEQDADVIVFLHPAKETPLDTPDIGAVEFIHAKVREGMIGTRTSFFHRPYAYFFDSDNNQINTPF